ncbi:restriction endonuclease subunit S [Kitasatospora sp. NPDC094011]|uniref:restriction endonuclease subunit S n=1 Tax=Kitasatospora sp. NPDC094011 TaxID=3364090 RepID=UPI0037FA550C
MTYRAEQPIPADWTTTKLGELCEIQSGPGHLTNPASRSTTGIPLLRPMNIGYRGQIVHADLTFLPREAESKVEQYRLRPGDIVCARTGDPGRAARITDAEAGWLFSGNLLRLRLHVPEWQGYLLHYLGSPVAKTWFEQASTSGVGIPSVTVAALSKLSVNLPPHAQAAAITELLERLAQKIAVHEEIARSTAELRDLVSPALFTGVMPPPHRT